MLSWGTDEVRAPMRSGADAAPARLSSAFGEQQSLTVQRGCSRSGTGGGGDGGGESTGRGDGSGGGTRRRSQMVESTGAGHRTVAQTADVRHAQNCWIGSRNKSRGEVAALLSWGTDEAMAPMRSGADAAPARLSSAPPSGEQQSLTVQRGRSRSGDGGGERSGTGGGGEGGGERSGGGDVMHPCCSLVCVHATASKTLTAPSPFTSHDGGHTALP